MDSGYYKDGVYPPPADSLRPGVARHSRIEKSTHFHSELVEELRSKP